MADKVFRTTASVVFWTETPQESKAIVEAIKNQLPDELDRDRVLTVVEYHEDGPPAPPEVGPMTEEVPLSPEEVEAPDAG